jgi:hypothetical protein
MMMGKVIPALMALSLPLLAAGCLSFSNRPLGIQPSAMEMRSSQYEVLGGAEGASSSFRLFWIAPVTPDLSIDEAVTEAIRSKGGDNLIEMCMSYHRDVYIVGTVEGIRVTGKVIRYTAANQKTNHSERIKGESQVMENLLTIGEHIIFSIMGLASVLALAVGIEKALLFSHIARSGRICFPGSRKTSSRGKSIHFRHTAKRIPRACMPASRFS